MSQNYNTRQMKTVQQHAPQPCRGGINHGLKALHLAICYGRVCFQNTTRGWAQKLWYYMSPLWSKARKKKVNDFVKGTIIIDAHCKWFAESINREDGCVGGDYWETIIKTDTWTWSGYFYISREIKKPMAAATMLMYEYESDLRSNEHYLSSSENKARKNSSPYGNWTHAYSFLSPQFT